MFHHLNPVGRRLLSLGRTLLGLVLVLSCGIVWSCEGRRGGEVEVYPDVAGEVVAVAPERRQITIAHEEIPGLMEAMTMSLGVEDPSTLVGVAAGDRIRFTLRRIDGKLAISSITRSSGPADRSPAGGESLLGGGS